MFNNLVLSKIKKMISDFEKVKFEMSGCSFKKSNYDIINTGILFNSVANERKNNVLIFHPHGSIFLLYAIGILSFSTLLRDLRSPDTSFEKNLRIGSYVKLDGSLGIYEGKCFRNGREHLKIRFGGKGNLVIYIPFPEDLGRLQLYKGSATKLKGYKKKKSDQKSKETISDILNLNKNQLNIIRTSQIAVVTENKNILDFIKEIKINNCKFTDSFPVARLTAADNYCAIPGIRLEGRQPVIYFVSSFGVLIDFIQEGNKINTLIIDSASKVKNNFSNINSLKDDKSIENILIFSNCTALTEKRDFEKIGFKSWVWTKKDFSELEGLNPFENPEGNFEDPFNSHYKVLNSLARQKIDLTDTGLPEQDTEKIFNEAMEIINKIRSYNRDADNTKLNELLITVLGCLFYFQNLIYPGGYELNLPEENDFYRTYSQNIINEIKDKTEELLSIHISSNLEHDFNKLLNILKKIKEQFSFQNFKADKLLNLLKENVCSSVVVIVRKSWQKDVLLGWLKNNNIMCSQNSKKRKTITVEDFKSFRKLQKDTSYDKVIFSGWYGYKNRYIFNSGVSPHIIFLLYPFEKRQVEVFINMLEIDGFNLRDPNCRAELLGINSADFSSEKDKLQKKDYFELEGDLTKIIDDLSLRTLSEIGTSYHSDEEDAVLASLVVFEENEFAFLTKNYRAKILNRIEESIKIKNPEDLEIGDEIIFLSDSRRDIFDELIQIIESSPSFSTEVRISKIWKNAIIKYMKYKNIDFQAFSEELYNKGCKKHSVTVRNWVESKHIIGPWNETETLKYIAEVTEDSDLLDNLRKVIHAFRKLRALHVRLGKYLAKCIFASVDPQQERKIEGIMRDRIRELSKCVRTARIKSIDNNYKTIAKNKVNRLIEEIGD